MATEQKEKTLSRTQLLNILKAKVDSVNAILQDKGGDGKTIFVDSRIVGKDKITVPGFEIKKSGVENILFGAWKEARELGFNEQELGVYSKPSPARAPKVG